jgi:hypothetical protein
MMPPKDVAVRLQKPSSCRSRFSCAARDWEADSVGWPVWMMVDMVILRESKIANKGSTEWSRGENGMALNTAGDN